MPNSKPCAHVFVISSPSGGGKTTVVKALLKRMPLLRRSISVTTRSRRLSERNRTDYRFVSPENFRLMRDRGELLESARVHRAWYGTPKAPVTRALARGRDVVLSIDVQGARQIKRRFGRQAVLVFLLPPSFKDLKTRLVKRRTETPDAIEQRLAAAKRELARMPWYDYAVTNRHVEDAVEQLAAIVVAERLRIQKARETLRRQWNDAGANRRAPQAVREHLQTRHRGGEAGQGARRRGPEAGGN